MSEPSPIARIFRHPVASTESRESSALLAGAGAFVLGALVGLVVFWDRGVPISGRGSIGDFAAVGGAVVAIAAFLFGGALRRTQIRRDAAGGRGRPRLRWFDIAALTLAHAIIALLGWAGFASVLSESFVGATVYATSAALLAGVALAVTAYLAFLSAVNLTPMMLSLVLALFLVVGALASMLSATDPVWWQENLSALGMTDDLSAMAFNLTLIVAGVIVTTIASYATANLPDSTRPEARGRSRVRLALVLIGVLLACVGIFPVDEFLAVHNIAATGMVVVYVALVVSLRRLLPSMPRVFVLLGYTFVGVIVVLAIFFVTGYYNLTAVELVAAVLIFSWIILFLRNSGAVETSRDVSTAPQGVSGSGP
ncbi:hypothetical protein C8K30_10860 [Promicromonospora sp. AC04]|uniref:hypothetical protein n=1 Tax=Promicromonospora sp. AC04 TaxID=2135723 RepID=UPI000D3519C1|nr:hypothetical protein [Promicromonospora sp. AC04]PUB24804.1 hypothetical protein C8K30_10860 [Promicromonospora sp. AC04]